MNGIVKARKKSLYIQREMADILDTSITSYSMWENNPEYFRLRELKKMYSAVGEESKKEIRDFVLFFLSSM